MALTSRKRKIKIVYLVDFFRTINAGTERQLGHLLTHLPQRGYDVGFVSLQNSAFLSNDFKEMFPNVELRTLGAHSDISKSIPSLFRLFCIIRDFQPDIVHTHFPASNSFGILISRLGGVRRLVSSRRDMGFNLTNRDITLFRFANHFNSCVVVNAMAIKNRVIKLENIPANKIRVIYNGVHINDINIEKKYKKGELPIIGIVANLNRPVKRVDLFIHAAALVQADFPESRFWVIGDGPLRKELEEIAFTIGLGSNITFHGRREDIQLLTKEMKIGVICSDSEGLSNSIMEYMAAGIPVVATEVGGNPELVYDGQTGILVPADDPDALADAIKRLLENREQAKRMGIAGQKVVNRRFSVEKMLKETTSLYEEILN